MHDRVVLAAVEADLERRLGVAAALPEKPRNHQAAFEQPHLDRVSVCRGSDQDWLLREEDDIADLLALMISRQTRIDLLLVHVPEYDVRAVGTTGHTRQETDFHALRVAAEGQRMHRRLGIELLQDLGVKQVRDKDFAVLKAERDDVDDWRLLHTGDRRVSLLHDIRKVKDGLLGDNIHQM